MAIFTEETQQKILTVAQEAKTYLKILANGWKVKDWKAVQMLVQMGAGPSFFPIGTQLNVASTQYGTLVFDVVAHDHHKNPNDASAHTMTLLQHYAIPNRQFDAPELLWCNTSGTVLTAATYNVTCVKANYTQSTSEDGTFQIVTTKDIPAGGKIKHTTMGAYRGSDYGIAQVLAGKWITYDADDNIIESNLACTEGSEGTNLGVVSVAASNIVNVIGTFNSTQRILGSNNWAESGMRQWLNADSTGWWKKQHIFDLAPSYSGINGYLGDLDPDFAAALGEVDNITKYNTVYNVNGATSGSYTTRDKVFLLSMDELGYGSELGIAEGSVLEFYKNADKADKIKYNITSTATPVYGWFMRSVTTGRASDIHSVTTWGTLTNSEARGGYVAPACVIY